MWERMPEWNFLFLETCVPASSIECGKDQWGKRLFLETGSGEREWRSEVRLIGIILECNRVFLFPLMVLFKILQKCFFANIKILHTRTRCSQTVGAKAFTPDASDAYFVFNLRIKPLQHDQVMLQFYKCI